MRRALIDRGGEPAGAESTARHMQSRDYPISTAELRGIMEDLGFAVQIHRYGRSDGPLGPYIASCSISHAHPSR